MNHRQTVILIRLAEKAAIIMTIIASTIDTVITIDTSPRVMMGMTNLATADRNRTLTSASLKGRVNQR